MIKWEYRTIVLSANTNVKGVGEYLNRVYPNWQNVPQHHIKTIEAQLDDWGQNGWELMHIESVNEVGDKGDLRFTYSQNAWGEDVWRKHFLCVFKRPSTDK